MSKTKNALPGFFHHYLAETALFHNWDPSSDVTLQAALEHKSDIERFSLVGLEGTGVTIGDLIDVINGNLYNNNFKTFCIELHRIISQSEKEKTPNDVLMVSMHSGSSDYFTWEMLVDYVESIPSAESK